MRARPNPVPAFGRLLERRIQSLRRTELDFEKKARRAYERGDLDAAEDADARATAAADTLEELLEQAHEDYRPPAAAPGMDLMSREHEYAELAPEDIGEPEDVDWSQYEEPERMLATLYASWLWQHQRDPRDQRMKLSPGGGPWYTPEEATEQSLAEHVRIRLVVMGELRPDVTDEELVEAARDAYGAYQARRGRYRRNPPTSLYDARKRRAQEKSHVFYGWCHEGLGRLLEDPIGARRGYALQVAEDVCSDLVDDPDVPWYLREDEP